MNLNAEEIGRFNALYRACESPIEKMMFSAIMFTMETCVPEEFKINAKKFGLNRFVGVQVPIGKYRADILIEILNHDESKLLSSLVVECDGHDYHDLTKEQAIRDRKRDRYLQALGHTVFRFTGSEIYNNAFTCAASCHEHMCKNIDWTALKQEAA